jgi:anthranilate synthase component 1
MLFVRGGDRIIAWPDGRIEGGTAGQGFLESLQTAYSVSSSQSDGSDADLPFSGGWFLFLSYELAGEIEPRLRLPDFEPEFPLAYADYCPGAVIIDHLRNKTLIVAESDELLAEIQVSVDNCSAAVEHSAVRDIDLRADDPADFVESVQRIHEYILDGDVFQVNLSRNWQGTAPEKLDPAALFECLGRNNPAPFAGLSCFADAAIISSSPERLVKVEGRSVQTRPIAGTRPRSRLAEQDAALSMELIAHPKERAEHIMLIDLERNDLGRVCEPGSVEVDEFMVVESYAHVHHIVSNVRGTLAAGATPVDVIRALFPGGTITGCPKVRCMEIVAELEATGRGFYTGSMGYLGNNGKMDLNILIRSMFVRDNTLSFRTGAGIVADSIPAAEVKETEAKAKGLLMTLQNHVI